MSDTQLIQRKELSSGDAAVDGLFGGVVAGAAMAVFLTAAGLAAGDAPLEALARFTPGGGGSPMAGVLLHLAVSGIYGVLFGLGCKWTARRWIQTAPAWVAGLAGGLYGLALWLVAQAAFLPGAAAALREFAPAPFILAHLLFGVILGILVNRNVMRER